MNPVTIISTTVKFSDGEEQIVLAPLVAQNQGTGLADLQQSNDTSTTPSEDTTAATQTESTEVAAPQTETVEPLTEPTE